MRSSQLYFVGLIISGVVCICFGATYTWDDGVGGTHLFDVAGQGRTARCL